MEDSWAPGTYRLLFSAVPMAAQSEYVGQIIEATLAFHLTNGRQKGAEMDMSGVFLKF